MGTVGTVGTVDTVDTVGGMVGGTVGMGGRNPERRARLTKVIFVKGIFGVDASFFLESKSKTRLVLDIKGSVVLLRNINL